MTKKILIDARKIDDYGIGEYVRQIVTGIHLNAEINFEYSFYFLINTNAVNFPYKKIDSEKIFTIKRRPFSIFEFIDFLKLKDSFDFFWATSLSHPIFGFTNRLITTVHDVAQIDLKPVDLKEFLKFKIIKLYLQSIAKKSRIIFFNSEFTRDRFLSYFYTSAMTVVTPLGSKYENDNEKICSINIQTQYFVILGNNRPHKNIEFAIKNFLLNKKLEKFNLHVIGSYPIKIQDVNQDDFLRRVIFFGKIPDYDLKRELKNSVALIFPSVYEGFGLPVLEAMSLSLPVICSNIAAIREVCGDAAFYFNPYSASSFQTAISSFLSDYQLNPASLYLRVYQRSNLYSWKRCIDLSASKLLHLK